MDIKTKQKIMVHSDFTFIILTNILKDLYFDILQNDEEECLKCLLKVPHTKCVKVNKFIIMYI